MSFTRNFSLQGGVANDDYWSSFTRNNFINNNRNKTRNNYNNRNFSNNKDYSGKFWQQNENFYHMKTGNSHYGNPDNYTHVNPNGAIAPSLKRRKFSASTWGGSGRHYVPSIAYDQAPLTCNNTFPPIRSNVEASMATGCKRDCSHLEDEEPVFLSRDEIERCSPSRKDGIDALREAHLRKKPSSKKKKKKWYSSEEYSSGESEGSSDEEAKKGRDKRRSKSKSKRSEGDRSGNDEDSDRSKKGLRSREDGRRKSKGSGARDDLSDSGAGTDSLKEKEIVRKEMGLEWMLRPGEKRDERPAMIVDDKFEETPTEEVKKAHPREMNPYWKDNGGGYPEDTDGSKASGDKLLSSSVVGDGGASWRLKALKRAQEQAAREGRRLNEVVEERWGSVGQLAVSVASRKAAPSRAHLHAIKDRKRGLTEEQKPGSDDQSERDIEKNNDRNYLKDVSFQHHKMREPKVKDSLSWGKGKSQNQSSKDADFIKAAVSSLNKFNNDGSFMQKVLRQQNNDPGGSVEGNVESRFVSSQMNQSSEGSAVANDALSANQLAAKAFQLRMKGKHEEANKLLQEAEKIKAKQDGGDNSIKPQNERSSSRYIMQDRSVRQKKEEDDTDMHLARKIMQNKKYTTYGQADDEYDFEVGPSKKAGKKGGDNEHKVTQKNTRLLTQKERCLFCFENPKVPKHLIVSIANFTYLMLPHSQPVVPGHCCILPLQHESATRTVDDNVWDEIRNFKKCLIMMFAKQERDVVFLETVMGLAQQRRHCLIECIPLPQDIAKEAPLYFKKAIDEAEDEWSQHNAKKLIDTSVKGLRASIPKNFPYFHVEFGLYKGFVHVIDDETQFKSSFGLNVIRGMLQLPEEDMHRRRRYDSVEVQREAVKSFVKDWEPFDWTKQLHQVS